MSRFFLALTLSLLVNGAGAFAADGRPYDVLVPLSGTARTEETADADFCRVKEFDSNRPVFAVGVRERDPARRMEQMKALRENVRLAKARGMKEVTAWTWTFWCSSVEGFTPMTASDGWKSPTMACPLCPDFRQFAGDCLDDLIGCGVDMVLLDDDFRYGNLHGSELVCTCPRHLALIERELGEKVDLAQFKKKVLSGGRNPCRDAWLKTNGEAFRDFAVYLRQRVDAVNPSVRMGLCSVMSHWDNDGVDAATTVRILAGQTRPFLRLIGAPYWSVNRSYYDARLHNIVEFVRMERSWIAGDDIEVVGEGDTYPRPRYSCPASYLELFDLALRATGEVDGILKYGIDYFEPAREDGYLVRHRKNRPLYAEIERAFGGKTAVGLRVYETMNRLHDVEIPESVSGTTKIFDLFGSEAAKCCSDLGVPTVWHGEGTAGVAFGPNVEAVPVSARRRGLVIDAWAARLLMKQGVDVGIRSWGGKYTAGLDVGLSSLSGSVFAYEAYRAVPADGAEVIAYDSNTKTPTAFVYRNAAGEKYLVLPHEAYFNKPAWHRSYEAGRSLARGIERLTGRKATAFAGGNPDVYVIAKDGADGSRAVGVFNMSADELIEQVVELDRPFASVRFINCRGRLEGSRVVLESVPAWAFAGFEVKGAVAPDVLCIYYPEWHVYPEGETIFGKGRTEWDYVDSAIQRFPGHEQPLKLRDGHPDDANPADVAKEIDYAADSGIDCFVYDWYWADGHPIQHEALEQGFLKAANRKRLKFALMWANHNRSDVFRTAPGHCNDRFWWTLKYDRAEFLAAIDYCIARYFNQPEYYRKDGKVFLSIYSARELVKGLGGPEGTKAVFAEAQAKMKAAGLPELHLSAMIRDAKGSQAMAAAGFDSVSAYNITPYDFDDSQVKEETVETRQLFTHEEFAALHETFNAKIAAGSPVPYIPVVSRGWDPSPRCRLDEPFPWRKLWYPYLGIIKDLSPDCFAKSVAFAKRQAEADPRCPGAILINAWNEYTEGSYLMPDEKNGDAYLKALRRTLVDKICPPRPETAATFREGAYPPAARPYREAAMKAFGYMTSLPAMRTLVETGEPEQTYQHNAYVSKTHAAHILQMLDFARAEPAKRAEALRFAKASAEYLLTQVEPADAPLAGWPPTYGRQPLRCSEADKAKKRQSMVGNEPAGAVKYRGEVMLLYPADVGVAFVAYYRETKDVRFLNAAVRIAETYLKTRRPDGSWPLKMKLATGEPIGENTLVPNYPMTLFNALSTVAGEAKWAQASDACFAWLEANPLADWNWDGQFEDIKPEKPYANPTKHNAIDTVFEILRRFPDNPKRIAQCRVIVAFCEKRFVCWERPESHPNWTDMPAVLEQYSCFVPIDASAAKMIRGYLALWRATKDPVLLAKARALGDTLTRVQQPNGRIPTFWTHDRYGEPIYDWLNCCGASAQALLELAEESECE